MDNKNLCKVCGKPLKQQLCRNCEGTGRVNHMVFLKRDCEYCGGNGYNYFCPNRSEHAKLQKKTSGNVVRTPAPLRSLNPIGQNSAFDIGAGKCPICGGTGVVKPAWMGGAAPCLRCNGTGRISVSSGRPNYSNIGKIPGNTFRPMGRVCPLCHGARGVPGPFGGAPGPCPKCGGTGRI